MKIKKMLAAVQFVWELFRFCGLFYMGFLIMPAVLNLNKMAFLFVLMLISPNLIVIALFFLLFLITGHKKNTEYIIINLLRLIKMLQILPVFIFLCREVIKGTLLVTPEIYFYLLGLLLTFDLIFLVVLISYKLDSIKAD